MNDITPAKKIAGKPRTSEKRVAATSAPKKAPAKVEDEKVTTKVAGAPKVTERRKRSKATPEVTPVAPVKKVAAKSTATEVRKAAEKAPTKTVGKKTKDGAPNPSTVKRLVALLALLDNHGPIIIGSEWGLIATAIEEHKGVKPRLTAAGASVVITPVRVAQKANICPAYGVLVRKGTNLYAVDGPGVFEFDANGIEALGLITVPDTDEEFDAFIMEWAQKAAEWGGDIGLVEAS